MKTTSRYASSYPRPYPGSRPATQNESISTRLVAAGLGIILGAGGLALGQRLLQDPNELTPCTNEWIIESIGTPNRVTNMPADMAALEAGRSELVARIHETLNSNRVLIAQDGMPAPFKNAAVLLIGTESGFTNFETSKSKLDTPREQFCSNPDTFGVYKTPEYVRAEAALLAAGIDIRATEGVE